VKLSACPAMGNRPPTRTRAVWPSAVAWPGDGVPSWLWSATAEPCRGAPLREHASGCRILRRGRLRNAGNRRCARDSCSSSTRRLVSGPDLGEHALRASRRSGPGGLSFRWADPDGGPGCALARAAAAGRRPGARPRCHLPRAARARSVSRPTRAGGLPRVLLRPRGDRPAGGCSASVPSGLRTARQVCIRPCRREGTRTWYRPLDGREHGSCSRAGTCMAPGLGLPALTGSLSRVHGAVTVALRAWFSGFAEAGGWPRRQAPRCRCGLFWR